MSTMTEDKNPGAVVTQYLVEMHGESREVYVVDADSPEGARENWAEGHLVVQESSSMEVYSVRKDED